MFGASTDEVGAVLFVGLLAALIAFIAVIVAVWGVVSQRAIARRNGTIEFIIRQESDSDIMDARRRFLQLAESDGGLAQYTSPQHIKSPSDELNAIRTVLNQYELLSIGIQRGVIDFETYCRWNRGGTIREWDRAAPFIFALRSKTGNDALFHEFEEMVSWMKKKTMPRRGRLLGKWF